MSLILVRKPPDLQLYEYPSITQKANAIGASTTVRYVSGQFRLAFNELLTCNETDTAYAVAFNCECVLLGFGPNYLSTLYRRSSTRLFLDFYSFDQGTE